MNRRLDVHQPLFEPVSRFSDATEKAREITVSGSLLTSFCTSTDAITGGVSLLLKILRRETLDDEFREDADDPTTIGRPLFGPNERAWLMALAIASLDALQEQTGRFADRLDECSREQADLQSGGVR